MILLGNKNTTTLTLGIYRYVGQFTRYMSETNAAVIITLIPIVILYFAFSTQIMGRYDQRSREGIRRNGI